MRPGQARGQRSHRCATIVQQASTKRRLASPTSSSGRPQLATSSSAQPRANIGRPSSNERRATSAAEACDKRGRRTAELQARRRSPSATPMRETRTTSAPTNGATICAGSGHTCVTLNGSGIQLAVGPQPLRLRNHNSGLAHRIMVKRLATSPHDPLGITDSACKNQLVVVSIQYGPFNPYIPIRSTTIGKSRVAIDPIAMHTSWRSNSDIMSVTSIGYPRMSASGESSTTMHRLLHASGSHPIPTPYDPKNPISSLSRDSQLSRCCDLDSAD
ncbi:Mechanosensitive channel of small conductance-like 10 isoform 1 [Dorcoceras hygrometricum]|uniref:Mechanosensitive channel of small conductance-like 10 isoform 1 n=1 Tax=Dorcoceras hygrometricum TaxID=472368 RepID=A0A2Z7BWZ4_9LAMI|nr:Mechanosensitive channel of small conductance-like 10 isoform 1 [Dorcoceras hygrometricum]